MRDIVREQPSGQNGIIMPPLLSQCSLRDAITATYSIGIPTSIFLQIAKQNTEITLRAMSKTAIWFQGMRYVEVEDEQHHKPKIRVSF